MSPQSQVSDCRLQTNSADPISNSADKQYLSLRTHFKPILKRLALFVCSLQVTYIAQTRIKSGLERATEIKPKILADTKRYEGFRQVHDIHKYFD